MPESTNEENETQTVSEKTDDRCAECDAKRRELRAETERKRTVFTKPATSPFHIAICDGSLPEIFRVRLLSIPQQRHAAAISIGPLEMENPSWGSESRMPPKRIKANPAPTRLSTFSLKMTHAIAAVATASRLSNREAALAGVLSSPNSKRTGRPPRPRGWPQQAMVDLFAQEESLPAERPWQYGSCAGRRVRRRNQDRAGLQSAPDWPTTPQPWPVACWLRKATLLRARWRCRYADSISREYSFLGRQKGIPISN